MQRLLDDGDDKDKINAEIQLDVNGVRDTNVDMKRRITETDGNRGDAINRLRSLQAERDRKGNMIDTMKADYQKKVDLVRSLEQEQFHSHEKIQKLNEEIEILKRQCS